MPVRLSSVTSIFYPLVEYKNLVDCVNECALPARTRESRVTRTHTKPPTPWWDRDCQTAYVAKRKVFGQYKLHDSFDISLRALWTTGRRMRNSTITNESERFWGDWLFQFAESVQTSFQRRNLNNMRLAVILAWRISGYRWNLTKW